MTAPKLSMRDTAECRVCFWPCPPDNDHYICPCCGTHASYEDWTREEANSPGGGNVPIAADEPDGVERCRASWNGEWWAADIERAPLIVRRLQQERTQLAEALTACQQEREEAQRANADWLRDITEEIAAREKAEADLTACRAQGEAMRAALKRAEPALWIVATSGHADAVAIHKECRAALSSTPTEPKNEK